MNCMRTMTGCHRLVVPVRGTGTGRVGQEWLAANTPAGWGSSFWTRSRWPSGPRDWQTTYLPICSDDQGIALTSAAELDWCYR